MKTDMHKLRGKIVERQLTQEEFAALIGMDASTFSRKMRANGLAFTVGQMHKIVDILALSHDEATQIFLQ